MNLFATFPAGIMKPILLMGLLLLVSGCLRRPARRVYVPRPDTPRMAPPTAFAAQDQRIAAARISDNPADWQRRGLYQSPWSSFWQPLNHPPTALPAAGQVVYRTTSTPDPWWVYLAVATAGITIGACAHRWLPGLIMRVHMS